MSKLTEKEQGYNEGLEWSADWLLGQASANDDVVKSFAKTISESILVHRKPWDRSVSPQDGEDEIECELCGHTKERHPDYVCRACACTDYRPKAEPPVAICPHCQTRWTWCDDNWFAVIKRLGGHCQCPDNWKCTLCNKPIQNPVDFAEYEKNGAHVKCAEQELTGHTQADPLIATEAEARAEDEIECELCGHTKERHPDYVCRACACTDYRPKAEPPALCICGHERKHAHTTPSGGSVGCVFCDSCTAYEPQFGHEPKASPSLEDATRAFGLDLYGTALALPQFQDRISEHVRQQRREAVAEFVRRVKDGLGDPDGYRESVEGHLEAVAKEMDDSAKSGETT